MHLSRTTASTYDCVFMDVDDPAEIPLMAAKNATLFFAEPR